MIRSTQSVADRDESRGHVGNHHRYQKGRHSRVPFGLERRGLFSQSLNAADPAAEDHADALTRIRRDRVERERGVAKRLFRGGNGVLRVRVEPAGELALHVVRRIESLDLTGESRAPARCVERRDGRGAAVAR